jgi:hypothetical protein
MAILIERLPGFSVGYNRARASYPDGDIISLHLGWIGMTHFRASLTDMLDRWKRVADDGVQRRAEMWINAETIGTDREAQ